MMKEEKNIINVMRMIGSKEACELKVFDIYDSLIEEDEIFVGGKSFSRNVLLRRFRVL